MVLSIRVPEVTHVSSGAAALAVFAALLLGWYGQRWWRAEHDEIRARAGLAQAVRLMWAARGLLAGAVVIGWLILDLWFRGQGR
jgi:hypothetical protein